MTDGRWRISVTAPDWGEDHLTLDAVVAFVDEELDPGPRTRATRHAARCQECAAQVVAQTQARIALRTAAGPRLPSSLLSSLRSIPQHAELPAAPAGLAISEDGQIVCRSGPEDTTSSALRSRPAAPSSTARPSTPPATPVQGASTGPVAPLSRTDAGPHGRRPVPRRIRLGTGVAVTGLALGALAFGATSASPSGPAPAPDRGVLGGSVLGGPGAVDARLRFGTQANRTDPVLDGLRELPGAVGSLRSLW